MAIVMKSQKDKMDKFYGKMKLYQSKVKIFYNDIYCFDVPWHRVDGRGS